MEELVERRKLRHCHIDAKTYLQKEVNIMVFVNEPNRLKDYLCCCCKYVAIDHRIANCGDIYCSLCLSLNEKKPCPNCQKMVETCPQDELTFDWFESEVMDLKVECEFKPYGCKDIVQLSDFLRHSGVCQYSLTEDEYQQREKYLEAEAIRTDTWRKELQAKSTIAVKELTQPQYIDEGDVTETPRHGTLWKIDGVEKKLRMLMDMNTSCTCFKSDELVSVTDGLIFTTSLFSDSQKKFVYINLTFSEESASTPFLHSRKYTLLDQSDALEKNNLEFIDRLHFGISSTENMRRANFQATHFLPVSLLQGENIYLKNNQILIMIVLERISLMYRQLAGDNGILHWRINNYWKRKKNEVDGMKFVHVSKPIKTSAYGYHLDINLHLNGYKDAAGRFLSIYTRAIVGENDKHLPSSFNCESEYIILDQSESQQKENIMRKCTHIFDRRRSQWGFAEFAQQSLVENPKYLKDDSILIKVLLCSSY